MDVGMSQFLFQWAGLLIIALHFETSKKKLKTHNPNAYKIIILTTIEILKVTFK